MPIVAQLVGAELGRPVAVDAHPKHAVALGGGVGRERKHRRLAGGPIGENPDGLHACRCGGLAAIA